MDALSFSGIRGGLSATSCLVATPKTLDPASNNLHTTTSITVIPLQLKVRVMVV